MLPTFTVGKKWQTYVRHVEKKKIYIKFVNIKVVNLHISGLNLAGYITWLF